MKQQLSIIIPAHNEERVIGQTIETLKNELSKISELEYEIIIVNDASTDATKEILEKLQGVKIAHHHHNKGYGASLKTGVKESKFENLLFFDADGQHQPRYISEMMKYIDEFDMVAGARNGYKGPLIRQPGKKILHWLVNYLTQQKIPDINCGLRIVKKDKISKYLHLLCNGFSFSTTSLLLFIGEDLPIKFVPITINKRLGKSMVGPKHALETFVIILKSIMVSSPLRVFLPISSLLFLGALISLAFDLVSRPIHITSVTILLSISCLLIFFFGLMADQLSAIRKEIKK
jgi:glycosyltransferase involved in cell wall biosynthesis